MLSLFLAYFRLRLIRLASKFYILFDYRFDYYFEIVYLHVLQFNLEISIYSREYKPTKLLLSVHDSTMQLSIICLFCIIFILVRISSGKTKKILYCFSNHCGLTESINCFLFFKNIFKLGTVYRDPAENQLNLYKRTVKESSIITSGSGSPIGFQDATLSVGKYGPLLLEDVDFLEELSHFYRERIPERVVHVSFNHIYYIHIILL